MTTPAPSIVQLKICKLVHMALAFAIFCTATVLNHQTTHFVAFTNARSALLMLVSSGESMKLNETISPINHHKGKARVPYCVPHSVWIQKQPTEHCMLAAFPDQIISNR